MLDAKYGYVSVENRAASMTEDEPVIVFRATDKLIVPLLARYELLYTRAQQDDFNPSASEFLQGVRDAQSRFHEWQQENPDRVKLPD